MQAGKLEKTYSVYYKTSLYFPTIDKIQALKLLVLVPHLSHREHPNFMCRSKVITI